MALTVIGAVASVLQNDATLGSLMTMGPADNPFAGEGFGGKLLPVMILVHNGETTEWTFESAWVLETTLLSVEFYAQTAGMVDGQIQLAVKAALNWSTALSISGANEVSIERMTYTLEPQELRDQNGEKVFWGHVDYKIKVQRNTY